MLPWLILDLFLATDTSRYNWLSLLAGLTLTNQQPGLRLTDQYECRVTPIQPRGPPHVGVGRRTIQTSIDPQLARYLRERDNRHGTLTSNGGSGTKNNFTAGKKMYWSQRNMFITPPQNPSQIYLNVTIDN